MASAEDIARLRAIGPAPVLEERFPDDESLGAFLDSAGTVKRAAGLLWEERVAQTSHLVNIREGSSQREMQQEFQNAVLLAARYLGHEFSSDTRKSAKTYSIER